MQNKRKEAEQASPQIIELSALPAAATLGESIVRGNLELVQSVRTKLTVVVGEASLTIGELMALRAEQVLRLDSLVDAPLDILLDGLVVARGQLVAVDDHFGVRITDLPQGEAR
ncbi:MAG: putative flagellar motor switch protein [Pseudoduganella sp.]|jgi:flagellar motor switch protein FliN/FliY|nr:putative flagellar motor switch protein [Pseudoduganella sp.]